MPVSLRSAARKGVIHTLIAALICLPVSNAWAQQPSPPRDGTPPLPPSSAIVTKICEPPPICFGSKEARLKYAKEHDCKFLEDVCEKAPASDDNKGAKPGDKGFWAGLWDDVSRAVKYGYEFGKGLFTGLKDQVTDLIELISNPVEVVQGLVALGKAFYDDPKGTLKILGELLGQTAIDTITRATQCGAYDLGKVIGSYVSPAVMLKLAGRLAKSSGKLADAVKVLKKDLGCASFVAGTLIQTPDGAVPIEHIARGNTVHSRHDKLWSDQVQRVDDTFGRVAPSYRELRTEFETFRLTDEHPLWVQGKGWTEAKDVGEDDVLASLHGDARVATNTAIATPVRVYNFSVAQTPSYFVGDSGLWAHNAKCELPMPYKAPKSPSGYKLGASDGGKGEWVEAVRDDTPHFRYEKQITGAPKSVEYEVNGKKFDGYDAKRDVLIDAKHYSSDNPLVKGEPEFLVKKFSDEAIVDAKNQVIKAAGTKVEWMVSSKEAATALESLFAGQPELKGKIAVVWVPDIVN